MCTVLLVTWLILLAFYGIYMYIYTHICPKRYALYMKNVVSIFGSGSSICNDAMIPMVAMMHNTNLFINAHTGHDGMMLMPSIML